MEWVIAWLVGGIISFIVIDWRFGPGAGTRDPLTLVVCAVLGPFAWILAWLPER